MAPSSPLSDVEVRARAEATVGTLLTLASPPDFHHLLPDVAARAAWLHGDLAVVERRVTEVVDKTKHAERCAFRSLPSATGQRHLVVAPPGAGKSHSARVLAQDLQSGDGLPIVIDVSTFDTADEVAEFVQLPEGLTLRQLKDLPDAVFILDGWSHFPSEAGANRIAERRKLLAAIGSARVITTGRRADDGDHAFRIWTLEPLSAEWCARVLRNKNAKLPSANVLELVRQPLMMLLWAGAEGEGNSAGELLSIFQEIATRDVTDRETLLQVVARACLRTQLKSPRRRKTTFDHELTLAARELVLHDAVVLVQRMGTLTGYGTVVRPFHDLYWAWLVGLGAIQQDGNELERTILTVPLRESFQLLGESDRRPSREQFETVLALDVHLASLLLATAPAGSRVAYEDLTRNLIRSDAAAHAYQGVKAALTTGCCVAEALARVTDLRTAGHYWPGLEGSVDVDLLWEARDDVAEWLATTPHGADYIFEALQRRGDERWAAWCEALALRGVLDVESATATAAACGTTLSAWAREALPGALLKGAWKFRLAAERGRNRDLAVETLRHYEGSNDPKHSRWLHLNRIIVGCGDHAFFETLCDEYFGMSADAQGVLSYAIDDLGDPWRTKVQQAAFRRGPDTPTDGRIFETMSRQIPADDAWRWARSSNVGVSLVGWRALAAGLQNQVVPDLIAALPDTMSGHHFLPALMAVQELHAPPEALAVELWKRLRGNIEPRAMQDFILALARITESGVPSFGDWLMRGDPKKLPAIHFAYFLKSLFEWERKTGKKVMVRYPDGDSFTLAITLFSIRLQTDRDDPFFDRICRAARGTNLATHLMHEWAKGDDALVRGVAALGEIEEYDAVVVDGFLRRSEKVGSFNWALFLSVFAQCLGTFPQPTLEALPIESAPLDDLIRAVARSPVPTHAATHRRLARVALAAGPSNFVIEDLSKIVACHGAQEATMILMSLATQAPPGPFAWLTRRTEHHLGLPIMSPHGKWLRAAN